MPRIRWSGLPPALRDHLFDRLCERQITAEDLYRLKAWIESRRPGGALVQGLRFVQDLWRRKIPEDLPTRGTSSQRGGTDTICDVTVSKPSNLGSPTTRIFREFPRALHSIRLEIGGLLIDVVKR